jgi:AcrR family transcriptional regulator
MSTDKHRVGEQRPGGRAERVRSSVLKAVFELLAEEGFERLSIEKVANRAGVHKTTVYRRWSTKAELVLDTARATTGQNVPIPDTGSLHGDLTELARSVVSNIGTEPRAQVTRSIVAASMTSEELASSMHTFWAERLSVTIPVVERAINRGELPASTDANLIIETLIGPMWVRLLLTGETIDDDLADRVAALVAGLAQPR